MVLTFETCKLGSVYLARRLLHEPPSLWETAGQQIGCVHVTAENMTYEKCSILSFSLEPLRITAIAEHVSSCKQFNVAEYLVAVFIMKQFMYVWDEAKSMKALML